jgi:drug/metabolite transporter (DMT)-like permease
LSIVLSPILEEKRPAAALVPRHCWPKGASTGDDRSQVPTSIDRGADACPRSAAAEASVLQASFAATLALYAASVLIWGSSWIMMSFQVGTVPVEASLIYRMGAASLLMFAWVAARRLPVRFTPAQHLRIALQGAFLFCCNYFLFYLATPYLTTGLIAVVMSCASVATMALSALATRSLPAPRVAFGALLGVVGIGIIFWPQIAGFSLTSGASLGLVFAIGGTCSFAIGGMIAARNQSEGLSVRGTSAWAMVYGAAILLAILVVRGQEFSFDPRFPYVASLAFLTVFATVFAFAFYFALLKRIGAERASYSTVLFPVVALTLSTLFEGYVWTLPALAGVALTLIGNVFVLARATGRISR